MAHTVCATVSLCLWRLGGLGGAVLLRAGWHHGTNTNTHSWSPDGPNGLKRPKWPQVATAERPRRGEGGAAHDERVLFLVHAARPPAHRPPLYARLRLGPVRGWSPMHTIPGHSLPVLPYSRTRHHRMHSLYHWPLYHCTTVPLPQTAGGHCTLILSCRISMVLFSGYCPHPLCSPNLFRGFHQAFIYRNWRHTYALECTHAPATRPEVH